MERIVQEHRVQTQAGNVLQWRWAWRHYIAKLSLIGKLLLTMMIIMMMMMMMMVNTTESERWRWWTLHRLLQRELDILKLFQAQPLAVDRNTEVAQVYRILSASHVFFKHDPTVMYTVVTRWPDLQTVFGFLPHRRSFVTMDCFRSLQLWSSYLNRTFFLFIDPLSDYSLK